MSTMFEDGDRTCPLCTEDMDLTDQQLKPCKCGYEICVWCWHHIIDMAEKDDTEGRCPACRTPYDKERIVGTAASCERMVGEVNSEKKHKSQKAKPKTSGEARKHLATVRVVQRNLVYIMGLPSNLSDESLLEHKEFFGQYGKVLKVSISRPAVAAAQQTSNNNTFSVYITYAREEEAVRCIQAVHNFILDGKPLRACFGTTKYCHAWLRNMTCSNPDCLYLHDIGSQEDSFTKDEIISAYTRSRVPQIASNNLQRRSGNMLPPPADDFSNGFTTSVSKNAVKSASNNITSQVKGSTSNVGKSGVLPAAASWGIRASNCQVLAASMACPLSPLKQKVEPLSSSSGRLSPVNLGTKQTSAWHDDVVTTSKVPEGRHAMHVDAFPRPSGSSILGIARDCRTAGSEGEFVEVEDCTSGISAWNDDISIAPKIPEDIHVVHMDGRSTSLERLGSEDKEKDVSVPGNNGKQVNSTSPETLGRPVGSHSDEVSYNCTVNGNIQSLCLDLSSVTVDRQVEVDLPNIDVRHSSVSNFHTTSMPKIPASRLDQCYDEDWGEGLASMPLTKPAVLSDSQASRKLYDWGSETQHKVFLSTGNEMEDSLLACDNHQHRLSDVSNQTASSSYLDKPSIAACSSNSSWSNCVANSWSSIPGDSRTIDKNVDGTLFPFREEESVLSCQQERNSVGSSYKLGKVLECPEMNYTGEKVKCLGRFDTRDTVDKSASLENGESSIISNLFSVDYDPWDESLSAANNFAMLLGQTDKQDNSILPSNSWKSQKSTQSRFSFARQENQANILEPSLRDVGYRQKSYPSLQDSFGDGFQSGSLFSSFEGPDAFVNPVISSSRPTGVSRSKISAPPGFSLPSKAAPKLSFQDSFDQAYDMTSTENHLLGSFPLGHQHQVQLTENMSDIEFIDPAILAVGRGQIPLGINNSNLGSRSALPLQMSNLETDPRLQLLLQQSMSSHQNQRMSGHMGDKYFPLDNAYYTSRVLAQNHGTLSPYAHLSVQQPRNSHMSNWNDNGNDVGMAEILRNEKIGLNNYYPRNEEHRFHVPSSVDLYNRAFGM